MTTEPLVLGFDTSAAYCAAALLRGDQLVARTVQDMKRGQAESLMPMLHSLLTDNDLAWSDLAVIGVGVGPGNFTGIRIAVSAARGLALGLGISAVGVSTFEATSCDHAEPHIAAVPAPRDQIYVLGASFEHPALISRDTELHHPVIFPPTPAELVTNIALLALRARSVTDLPRPAPLYIKPADAAPPRDPAPVILA